MKFVLVFALIFAINLPCFAQLTVEQVRQIIREELEPIKLDVAEMKGKMATKDELEAVKLEVVEMKGKMVTKDELEAVRDKLEAVRLDVVEMKGKMATKDDIITVQAEVGSKMLLLTIAFITAWITIIAAIITIPYLYGRSDREKVK